MAASKKQRKEIAKKSKQGQRAHRHKAATKAPDGSIRVNLKPAVKLPLLLVYSVRYWFVQVPELNLEVLVYKLSPQEKLATCSRRYHIIIVRC